MKKFVWVLLLAILASTSVFAGTVDAVDGYFWITMPDSDKSSAVFGYLIAMATTMDFFKDTYTLVENKERTDINKGYMDLFVMLSEWVEYPMSVAQIRLLVDEFYSDYSNRDVPLFLVIPFVCEKQWW